MAGFLLALIGSSDAPAGEWERSGRATTNALRTHEKRIEEIEAKERGVPDQRAARGQDHAGQGGVESRRL